MFLIYGEDYFLIKMQKNKILKKINFDNKYFLQEYSYLEDSLLLILDNANTISLFSEKKIIIINDSYFITKEKIKTKINNNIYLSMLIKYLKNPNPDTFIIFICPVDNINKQLKITKQILISTIILKKVNLSYNKLIRFINNYIIKNNGNIEENLISKIIEYLPNNLYIIKNELNKLLSISFNITNDLIENNITKYLDIDIFELVNFLLKNDLKNFLISYYYLQEQGINNILLLTLIIKNIIFVRNIIVLFFLKKTLLQISKILQINIFRIKKISENIHNFNIKKANNIIKELFIIEYNIKKGIIKKEINIDLYLIKLFNVN